MAACRTPHLIVIMFTQYALKSGWEIIATPLTYRVVAFLKKAENEDYYDIGHRISRPSR